MRERRKKERHEGTGEERFVKEPLEALERWAPATLPNLQFLHAAGPAVL